jgi:hypothetical protein
MGSRPSSRKRRAHDADFARSDTVGDRRVASVVNSAAVSPLSFQRSTRFDHSSLDVRAMSASQTETYDRAGERQERS